MSDLARGQNDARSAWLSPFQFEPSNGGLGVELDVTSTSQRVELVGNGFTIMVTNDGPSSAHMALGDGNVEATDAHLLLIPASQCFTLKPEDQITHVALKTRDGATAFVQITRGNGG